MPKYRLIRDLPFQKADDTEWEIEEIKDEENKSSYFISKANGSFWWGGKMDDWGDPLTSGWFEEVKSKRWRAERTQAYFFFDDGIKVFETREGDDCLDEARFNSGNYFRTREQAEEAANRTKKLLAEYQEEINKE